MSELEIPLLITPDDGDEYALTADTRDLYTWEKTTPNKTVTLQQVMEELRFQELYRIAWITARRQGMTALPLDEFAATHRVEPHDNAQAEEEGEGSVPTGPAASAGPSSRSPSPPASPRRSGAKKASGR